MFDKWWRVALKESFYLPMFAQQLVNIMPHFWVQTLNKNKWNHSSVSPKSTTVNNYFLEVIHLIWKRQYFLVHIINRSYHTVWEMVSHRDCLYSLLVQFESKLSLNFFHKVSKFPLKYDPKSSDNFLHSCLWNIIALCFCMNSPVMKSHPWMLKINN